LEFSHQTFFGCVCQLVNKENDDDDDDDVMNFGPQAKKLQRAY